MEALGVYVISLHYAELEMLGSPAHLPDSTICPFLSLWEFSTLAAHCNLSGALRKLSVWFTPETRYK